MQITDAILEEAVAAMDHEFDTHDVITHVMRNHPQDYVEHLHSHVAMRDPIQQGHASIGRKLATFATIEKTDRPQSPNVRGTENENQGWRKK